MCEEIGIVNICYLIVDEMLMVLNQSIPS